MVEVLMRCKHNGFPVVRCSRESWEAEGFDELGQGASVRGPLQGIILRSQLLVMLKHQARWLAYPPTLVCYFNRYITQEYCGYVHDLLYQNGLTMDARNMCSLSS